MKTSRVLAVAWLVLLLAASGIAEIWFWDWATNIDASQVLEGPSWRHPFGTDSLGRDLLSRLLIGTRISLSVGVVGSLVALTIGLFYGLVAGWRGGLTDRALMRVTDVLLSVPSFALVAVISLGLQSSLPLADGLLRAFLGLALGIGLTHWMNVARVTRGLVLQTRTFAYVEAARAIGARDSRVLGRHILPNIAPHLLVLLGLQIPANILYESFMSFIGVGVQPPHTSWGLLVQEGWKSLSVSPHLILFPALILFLTVWSLHVLLESLRGARG